MCGMKAIRHKGDSYSGRHSTSGDFFGLETENPDIYEVYGSPAAVLLALAILAGLLLSLMALAGIAFRPLRVGS